MVQTIEVSWNQGRMTYVEEVWKGFDGPDGVRYEDLGKWTHVAKEPFDWLLWVWIIIGTILMMGVMYLIFEYAPPILLLVLFIGWVIVGVSVAVVERVQRHREPESREVFTSTFEPSWSGPIPGVARHYNTPMDRVLDGFRSGLAERSVPFKAYEITLSDREDPQRGVVLEMERRSVRITVWQRDGDHDHTYVHLGPFTPENKKAIGLLRGVLDDVVSAI